MDGSEKGLGASSDEIQFDTESAMTILIWGTPSLYEKVSGGSTTTAPKKNYFIIGSIKIQCGAPIDQTDVSLSNPC